ncbi:MAG: hypothetical protein A3E53_03440 [Gammaproteobacteria bacterium RIFCSPHIGHO2_12_FULL_39_24]|nr:MAG: hypothetical protein A3E53_03440 [Gammaproteobacteria bacterium RIFCSPHIGHO2_12_FULL_39_24]
MKYNRVKNSIVAALMIGVFFACTIHADIYRSVDKEGVVTFTDQPNTDAEKVTLGQENISSSPVTQSGGDKNNADANSTDIADSKHVPYTLFEMSSPKNQDTISNATEVKVTVNINPALQKGDKIRYNLDGKPISDPITDTTFTIQKISDTTDILPRGPHTFSADILDADHKVIKTTPTITVFFHYASIYFPHKK